MNEKAARPESHNIISSHGLCPVKGLLLRAGASNCHLSLFPWPSLDLRGLSLPVHSCHLTLQLAQLSSHQLHLFAHVCVNLLHARLQQTHAAVSKEVQLVRAELSKLRLSWQVESCYIAAEPSENKLRWRLTAYGHEAADL